MRIRTETCSDGVAVIVPADVAARAGLRGGEAADLELASGRLVVGAVRTDKLADLLAGITPQNLHRAWADGPPAGNELL